MDCHRKRKHTAAEEDSAVDRGQQQQHPHAHAHQHQHGHQHQQQSKKHKSEHQSGSASGAWTLPLPLPLPLALGPAPAPKRPRIEIPSYASTPTSPASTVGSTSSLALTSTLASTSTSTPTETPTRGAVPRRVRLRRQGHRAEGSSAQVSSSTPTATHHHHPSPLHTHHAHPQPQSHPQHAHHHTLLRTLLASPHIPPLQPLITRQTLRELDPGVVLRNTVIRHDLLFDSGLQFRPRRARSEAERYWDAVRVEVETGCTCVTLRVTGSGGGTEKMDTVCVCGGLSSSSSSPPPSLPTPTSSSPPSSPTAKRTETLPSLHPISNSPNTYTLRLPSRLPALINELRAVLLVVVMPLRRVVHSSACVKEAGEGGGGNQEDKTWCTSADKDSQYATHALELAALVDPEAMCAAVRRGWPVSFVPADSLTSASTPSSPTTASSSMNSTAQSHQELDPASLFARIGATLKEHCAPMRDRRVDEMVEAARKPGVGAAFSAVQMCLEVLEVMKLDIANHQLTSLRPHLLRDTPAFETKALRIRFGHGPDALGATRTWVGRMDAAWRARDMVIGEKGPRATGGVMGGKTYGEMTRNQRVFLCVLRGMVDLVFENAVRSDSDNTKTETTATPETLYLDKMRIAKLGLEAGDAGAVYMFSVLFRSLVAGSGLGLGSSGSGSGLGSAAVKEVQLDEMMEALRREMRDICPGPGGLGGCFVGPAGASSSSTTTKSTTTFQLTPPIVRSSVQALLFPLVPPTPTTTTPATPTTSTTAPTPAPAHPHLRCGQCACSSSTTSTHTQTHPRHKLNVEDKAREEQERDEEMLKRRRAREDLALQVARRAGEVRRGVYTPTHTNDNDNTNTNTDACGTAEDAMDVDDHHITPPDPALVSRALQWTQTNMHADAPVAKLLLARVKEAVVDEVVEIVCGRAFFGSGGGVAAEVTPGVGVGDGDESTTTTTTPHRESKGGLSAVDLSGLSMWTGRGPVGARSGAAAAVGDGTWFSAPSSPSPTRTPTPSGFASTPSSPYPSPSPSPFSSSSSPTPSATKHHPRLLALSSNPAHKSSQGMRGAVADEIRRVAERVARLAGIHLGSYLGVYEEGAVGGWVG